MQDKRETVLFSNFKNKVDKNFKLQSYSLKMTVQMFNPHRSISFKSISYSISTLVSNLKFHNPMLVHLALSFRVSQMLYTFKWFIHPPS